MGNFFQYDLVRFPIENVNSLIHHVATIHFFTGLISDSAFDRVHDLVLVTDLGHTFVKKIKSIVQQPVFCDHFVKANTIGTPYKHVL